MALTDYEYLSAGDDFSPKDLYLLSIVAKPSLLGILLLLVQLLMEIMSLQQLLEVILVQRMLRELLSGNWLCRFNCLF